MSIRCYNCSRYGHYQTACPVPKRPDGSCFRCGQLEHVYCDCPSRQSGQQQGTGAIDNDDSDIESLYSRMNAMKMVSVGVNPSRCADTYRILSLLDSGSPRSFISSKYASKVCRDQLLSTKYRGVGYVPLMLPGNVTCTITLKGFCLQHTFVIQPKADIFVPMIIGRDSSQG